MKRKNYWMKKKWNKEVDLEKWKIKAKCIQEYLNIE